MDREEVRKLFTPLLYRNITQADFYLLVSYLCKEFEAYNQYNRVIHAFEQFAPDTMYLDVTKGYPKFNTDSLGYMTSAFIKVNFCGIKGREAISFNKDGFIGFAGWADSDNLRPIINAFINWVHDIKKEKHI